jgi:uridine kinase
MHDTAELKKILIEHYKRYPCMQVQDMVKLIYQNEFAGGHLVGSREESLARLREEYMSVVEKFQYAETDAAGPSFSESSRLLFEDIGNRLCRINLAALVRYPICLETVNSFFVYTANTHKGDAGSFEHKLEILKNICDKGVLPFRSSDLEEYIRPYRAQGYPAVSHSDIYRKTYRPAYRIVNSDFRRYFDIFCRIDELLERVDLGLYHKNYITVAVEGSCCSGKSSLAALLDKIYDCNVFHMDHFFLTPELRTGERLNETGGNVDYARFRDEVIRGIESGGEFEYRIYDCSKEAMVGTVHVAPKKLNVIEGSYSMHPALAGHYDLRVFLSVDAVEQSRRILERNGPALHRRFMEEWVPKENRYFEEFGIASKCDIVLQV